MATATRQIPTSIRRSDFIDRDERENSYLIDRDETGNRESMQNVYLRGAYEKRLKELERFAEDKNFWALADHQESNEEIFNDYESNILRKRRLIGPPSRRRKIAQRRKQDFDSDSGIYDYVEPLSFSDIYGSPSSYSENRYPSLSEQFPLKQQQQQPDSITRRLANAVFNPVSSTMFAIIAVPLIIAAIYWLFVVNGPTPVVKARIEDENMSQNGVENYENYENYEESNSSKWVLQLLKLFVPVVQQE